MDKHQIKHRFTDAVLFECDVPADMASWMHTRFVLGKAMAAAQEGDKAAKEA